MAETKEVKKLEEGMYVCTNVKTKEKGLEYHSSTAETLVAKGILKVESGPIKKYKPKSAK
jgi:hypothetical protein